MAEWLDFSDFIEKVHELIDLGLFEDAQSLLDQYAGTFSDEWELYFLYSRIYAEQNKPEQAILYLHKGLHHDPTNVDCLLGLFYSYTMLNKVRKAGSYLLRAEKYHPAHEQVISSLIWYYSEINNLDAAISYFERARANGSNNPETYRNGGIAYDRAGFYENAVDCFTTALELHPLYDEVREMLSDLFIMNGKPEKAVALYEEALAASPQNIRYLSRLVYCLSQNNQPEKAMETAHESLRLYPNSPIGYVDLAYVYLNKGEVDKAMAMAEKSLNIAPLDAESYRLKALVYSEKDNPQEAENAFNSALSLDPDNPEILRDYYHFYRQTGNFEKMEEMVFKVIAMTGLSCAEDYWFLSDYYQEKRDLLKAMHYLCKAYKIRPGEYDLLPMISEILLAKGHTKCSLQLLRRYVERAGWNDLMEGLVRHPRLKTRTMQENLRFLRYYRGKPAAFRRYGFSRHLAHIFTVFLGATLLLTSFPVYVIFGKEGLIGMAAFTVAFIAGALVVNIFRGRYVPIRDAGANTRA